MRTFRHSILTGIFAILPWAWEASAQAPAGTAPGGGNQAPNQVLVDMYFQLEALKEEVLSLRGMVDEQAYQIQRMEQEQRNRYLDLDRRLSAITSGSAGGDAAAGNGPGPASPPIPGTEAGPQNGGPGGQIPGNDAAQQQNGAPAGRFGDPLGIPPTVSAPQNAVAAPADEQELYRTALNLLLEESDYEQAISLFQRYIDNFPMGAYITNAYYWQGEALILAGRHNQAKDVFMKILDEHPNDPKAPGAMLKLGVAYSNLGDRQLATQLWQDIRNRYPESATEIRAAEDYLRRSGN